MSKIKKNGPWILTFDIETRPMEVYTWGLFDVTIPLNMLKRDWGVLSWSAKWYQDKAGTVHGPHNRMMYKDLRKAKDVYNDKPLLQEIWDLLDSADIVITQNGKKFDSKKLNSRFLKHKMGKPSIYRHFDTLIMSKKYFAHTSNKLEYMSDQFNSTYKKQKHEEFAGFSLWEACIAGNQKAWKAMEKYNRFDVLATEEYATTLLEWDDTIDLNVFSDSLETVCSCGSSKLMRRGFNFSNTGKFQRFQCQDCGKWTASKMNLLSKEKKKALREKV